MSAILHSMTESAHSVRDRRIQETTRRLASIARRWTAERGLAGFTIEELCEEVGVSRRTFFNYYASKEHAVLGVPVREVGHAELDELFVRLGADPNADLLDDLVAHVVGRWALLGIGPGDGAEFRAVIDREPHLLGVALGLATEDERAQARLIARREGWPDDDLRAAVGARLVGAVIRGAMEEHFAATAGGHDVGDDVAAVEGRIRRHLDAIRALLRP